MEVDNDRHYREVWTRKYDIRLIGIEFRRLLVTWDEFLGLTRLWCQRGNIYGRHKGESDLTACQ